MSNKIDIKRSYFNSNEYGRIIDNSFRELSTSRTGSVSDFVDNFLTELPNMSPEVLDFFASESKDFTSPFDSSTEVDRLNSILTGSTEEKEKNRQNSTNEHPIIPNGSFLRTGGQVIKDDKIRLRYGTFYYIQEGYIRKIDSPSTFLELFRSKTNGNPYFRDTFKKHVPYVDQSFINGFPQGAILTEEGLAKENAETNIRIANNSTPDNQQQNNSEDSNGDRNNNVFNRPDVDNQR